MTAPSWTDDTGDAAHWRQYSPIAVTVPAVDAGDPAPAYAATGLPTGIAFNAATRQLSGSPLSVGSGTITVRATNSAGSDTWTMAWAVAASPYAVSVSDAFRQALYAESSGDALATLITFHLSLPNQLSETKRVTDQPGGITKGTDAFAFHPMELRLPAETPGSAPKAQVRLDNIDRTLSASLRTALSVTADIELVLASAPNNVERSWYGIETGGEKWDVLEMTVDLLRADGKREPYPVPSFTPSMTPGAH